MAAAQQRRQHLVAVALPSQGHLNVVMRFCKLLLHHRPDFLLTFVDIDLVHDRLQEVTPPGPAAATAAEADDATAAPPISFADGAGAASARIRRAHIPVQGIDLSNDFHLSFGHFMEALHSIDRPLHELILRLNRSGPPVTCLVADFTITLHTQYAVDRLAIPRVVLYPFSASRLLLLQYVLQEQQVSMTTVDRALATASTQKELFCRELPGLPPLFNVDIPHFKHVGDDSRCIWEMGIQALQLCSTQAHSIVVNTFHELEASALQALAKLTAVPVYPMGPLAELLHTDTSTSLWKEDDACISWLDEQPRSSVLYISFGSIAVLTQAQFGELLRGLLCSEQRFLWSLRRGLVRDADDDASSPSALVLSKAEGRGYVVEWAPQVRVLAHPSVGGFLTHCGWNSVVESIAHGIPMLCWPYFADQPINARCAVDMWKIGLQFESAEDNLQLIQGKQVERAIRSLMGGQEGETVRRNVALMKKACNECLSPSGSSHKNIEAFIGSLI